ncbi:MAG: hypothetical protein KGL90_11920 [Burkholderiales bacterium]|nr:hypothetical protein [Burkholderiales bacterium]
MKKFLLICAMVLGAFVLAGLIVWGHGPDTTSPAAASSPWQIERLPNGASRVFGLNLSADPQAASTLGDAQRLWSSDIQIAVIAAPGENGSLEAYIESAVLGFVTGKLVVTADVSPELIGQFRERATKAEFMDGTTRKYRLTAKDMATALRSPVLALAFIPQAQLDEATITARFGKAAQRVSGNEHTQHWLYPDKGLSVTLDTQGKELLQYVAPARFALLRDPLLKEPKRAP